MNNKLVKKFLEFSYGSWIGLLLGILTTMITTRLLSPDDLGKASMYALALNIFMIVTILGTDQSFVRFFHEEKTSKRSGLLYRCLKFPMIATIIFIIIFTVFYEKITLFLFGEVNFFIGISLVVGLVVQLLYRYAKLVIRMQQKGNIYSILEILQRFLSLCFLILFFYTIGEIYEIVIYSTLLTMIILLFIAILVEKDFWKLENIFMKELKHSNKDIMKYGAPFILTIFITYLFQAFDKIALRMWSSFDELGLYSAAFNIVALLLVIQTTFSAFWTPVSYERFEKNPNDKKFFEKISSIIALLMFSVAIITIAGKELIVLLLGQDFREAATIMPFLVFMPVLYTISETTVLGINFLKKTKWHILIASIACLVNIFGNWLLIPEYGAIGASISTAFAYVIFFALRTNISMKLYKVNYELKKIYFMIIVISIYAVLSIEILNIELNILMGISSLIILVLVYFKNILTELRNINSKYKMNKYY